MKEIVTDKQQLTLKEGTKDKIVVKAKYDNSEKDVTDQVSFWINDEKTAEIIANGEVRGLKQGQTTLVGNYRGKGYVSQYTLKTV